MLRTCVIGVGNAGNQVAELANSLYKIPACAINSSQKDLSTVTIPSIILGTKGSGKDREVAKHYLKDNFNNLLDLDSSLCDVIENAELVFIVSSTGGGTGSGMTPALFDILKNIYKSKKFIIIGILPEIRESIASQQNSIEWLKEVVKNEYTTYMLYDNNRHYDSDLASSLSKVNHSIVEDIHICTGYYQIPTKYNSIDEKDLFKILNTPGMLNISKRFNIKEKELDRNDVEDLLLSYIKSDGFMCETQRDMVIIRSGLILNLNSRLQRYVDKSFVKIKDLLGEAIEAFEHDYITENSSEVNNIILILSGLSIPDDRIAIIDQRIADVREHIKTSKTDSILDATDDEFIRELRRTSSQEEVDLDDEVDVESILSKYIK